MQFGIAKKHGQDATFINSMIYDGVEEAVAEAQSCGEPDLRRTA